MLAADSHLQPNVTLIVVVSSLVAAGVYLLLERSLTRVLLGIVLMSNGVAGLFMVVMGRARGAPLLGERPPEEMSDPLPEAFVLTAIVISLATIAFMMAMAYRYWRLTGSDDVPDDLEDALILRLAERDQPSESYDADVTSTTAAEEDPDEVEAREAEEQSRVEAAARRAAIEADVTAEYPDVESPAESSLDGRASAEIALDSAAPEVVAPDDDAADGGATSKRNPDAPQHEGGEV